MGITKSEIFTEEQNTLARIAKVLGHPARIAILQYLFQKQDCICGEIVDEIGLAQPTISQHLKELKSLGLIQGELEGNSICYCIHRQNWSAMKSKISAFLDQDITQVKPCCS